MRLTITVPDSVAEHARQLAGETGRSVSSIAADALAKHVREERRRLAFESIESFIGTGDEAEGEAFDRELRALRAGSDREV